MAISPLAHSEVEPARDEHHEQAGQKVLAHLGFGPAFPGILIEPDAEAIESAAYSGVRVERQFLVSLGIARWIGVLKEAYFGGAQVQFTWHPDVSGLPVLAIEDDPWDEAPQTQPRLVYPDDQGRYALTDVWVALNDEQTATWMASHTAVLDHLATILPSPSAPATITDYLQLGQAHRDFDPDYRIRGIRRALADYAERRSADPIVDVIVDPATEPSTGVTVLVNGRAVPTNRCFTIGADVHVAAAHDDPVAGDYVIFAAIEEAEALLTPPAAALVRARLESRLRAHTILPASE